MLPMSPNSCYPSPQSVQNKEGYVSATAEAASSFYLMDINPPATLRIRGGIGGGFKEKPKTLPTIFY
jgi:hypothetical protein